MAYQGYKNWNHWNVSLWINNDEGLYSSAVDYIKEARTKDVAARSMMAMLEFMEITHTPDGAPYSVSSIRAALVGM